MRNASWTLFAKDVASATATLLFVMILHLSKNHLPETLPMSPSAKVAAKRPEENISFVYEAHTAPVSWIKNSEPSVSVREEVREEVTLCLKRKEFYGHTSNRLLTIARGLKIARELHRDMDHGQGRSAKLVLMAGKWFNFYPQILDPHPDILLANKMDRQKYKCLHTMSDKKAYGSNCDISRELHELMPRHDLQHRALEILRDHYHLPVATKALIPSQSGLLHQLKHPIPFISVHRRWFEGGCYFLANSTQTVIKTALSCSTRVLTQICDLSFSALSDLEPDLFGRPSQQAPQHNKIILFTDGQRPQLDATFPLKYNASLSRGYFNPKRDGTATLVMLEIAMMIMSEHHFGNPMSTVDLLVSEWRKVIRSALISENEENQNVEDRGQSLIETGILPSVCFP